MYKYYNAHPTGRSTDDCVKRAITITSGMDYKKVQRELNAFKKVTGAKTFNSDNNPHHYVEDVLGAQKITLSDKISANQFCKEFSKGRYILDMAEHWSCCVDGVIYDTWDTGNEAVNFAYRITPLFQDQNQTLRYCCTCSESSNGEALIRIYDGNGAFTKRLVPQNLAEGYIRCLEDSGYTYVKFGGS